MNILIIAVAVVMIFIGGYAYYGSDGAAGTEQKVDAGTTVNSGGQTTPVVGTAVKEFTMDSWMETKDGKMAAFFSLKEIKVKKGDTVKITVTNTAGTHDFVLDEFGVKKDTPLNQPVVIEFVADKVGTFEYYCSKYNHRQIGQKGNLIVE